MQVLRILLRAVWRQRLLLPARGCKPLLCKCHHER